MERSLQVATTAWKAKNLNFFQKSSKLNFDLYILTCTDWYYHSIHKHSSRSQHAPYDDIGDASSSLRGSTSSLKNC